VWLNEVYLPERRLLVDKGSLKNEGIMVYGTDWGESTGLFVFFLLGMLTNSFHILLPTHSRSPLGGERRLIHRILFGRFCRVYAFPDVQKKRLTYWFLDTPYIALKC